VARHAVPIKSGVVPPHSKGLFYRPSAMAFDNLVDFRHDPGGFG
jgi:hypothetical protein